MENKELLQAMRQIVREEIKQEINPLREDISGLKGDVSSLKEDVSVLKEDVSVLKEDVSVLKEDMEDVKVRLTNVEWESRRASALIENEIQPHIRILAESHTGMADKLKKVDFDDVNEAVDIIKSLVRDEVLVKVN